MCNMRVQFSRPVCLVLQSLVTLILYVLTFSQDLGLGCLVTRRCVSRWCKTNATHLVQQGLDNFSQESNIRPIPDLIFDPTNHASVPFSNPDMPCFYLHDCLVKVYFIFGWVVQSNPWLQVSSPHDELLEDQLIKQSMLALHEQDWASLIYSIFED